MIKKGARLGARPAHANRTHPRNVPVRPSWFELHRNNPPPSAAAEVRCLEGHVRATGHLLGPPGQPAVTMFRIEGLVCCTTLASAQPSRSSALRHGAPLAEVISTRLSPSARMRPCKSLLLDQCQRQDPPNSHGPVSALKEMRMEQSESRGVEGTMN